MTRERTPRGTTRSDTRGRLASAVLAGLLAACAPFAAAAPALAAPDPGDTVRIGSKQGYGGTGMFPIWYGADTTGEPDTWAYCIEHDVAARTNVDGIIANPGDYLGDNHFVAEQGKVFWVLGHGYPALSLEEFGAAAGVPGISQSDAAEAMQYAIWRYTDLSWDASWQWSSAASEQAYWYLVNGANAGGDAPLTADVTGPTDPQTAGTLVGPLVVHTSRPTASVATDPAVPLVDAAGDPIDAAAVVDGQQLYLDLRGSAAAGSATVTVTAKGSSGTGAIVSVPAQDGGVPSTESHAQTIALVAPSAARATGDAVASWAANPDAETPAPTLATSLVDGADQDRVLPWHGGTAVDTVRYEHLTPGTVYTVAGELMRKSDGSATGITATATFTPTAASGSVEVVFTVPEGFAGEALVAFEWLSLGSAATGAPIAEHTDLTDVAQTVTVERKPTTTGPGVPGTGGTTTGTTALAKTGAVSASAPLVCASLLLALVGAGLMAARRRTAD